jgi:uridine phosphorylase
MRKIAETDLILNADGSVYHLGLLPEHVGELIITVGDPDRVAKISKYLDWVEYRVYRREFVTHVGYLGGKKITIISTGMGTDNIDIVMNELDALVNSDLGNRTVKEKLTTLNIIRVGTSGALHPEIKVGTHIYSDIAIGIDSLAHFYNAKNREVEMTESLKKNLGLKFDIVACYGSQTLISQYCDDMLEGVTVTCPGFYAPQGRMLRIAPTFPDLIPSMVSFNHNNRKITNFEMETSGYYLLSSLMGHNIVSISTILANRATNDFSADPEKEIEKLIQLVIKRIYK